MVSGGEQKDNSPFVRLARILDLAGQIKGVDFRVPMTGLLLTAEAAEVEFSVFVG